MQLKIVKPSTEAERTTQTTMDLWADDITPGRKDETAQAMTLYAHPLLRHASEERIACFMAALTTGAVHEAFCSFVTPFTGLDETDGVTPRESRFFVLGVEFEMVRRLLAAGLVFTRPVHSDNVSRLRSLAEHLGRASTFEPHAGYEGCETWHEMGVE